VISLRTHNIMDYFGGAFLLLSPLLFGFADLSEARNLFMAGGFLLILYSFLTNYEVGAVRMIPLGAHMALDVILGVSLILGPWLLNYREFLTTGQEWLHYFFGVSILFLVGFSREKTETDKREHGLVFHSVIGRS